MPSIISNQTCGNPWKQSAMNASSAVPLMSGMSAGLFDPK
jgi:hypothetical protein